MDKKHQSKAHSSGRPSSTEQQAQLAMLQQFGIPFDPNLMAAYGLPPGIDAQQLLNPMAANGYPFMNPAAMQAFTGLGSLGSGQGGTGAAEWWNLAQNQALAAGLGVGGYFPGMHPGFSMAPPNLTQDTNFKSLESSSTSKVKDFKKQSYDKISPRPDSRSSPSVSRLQQDRKHSREPMNSSIKDRPDSHHSTSSPFRALVSKQNDSSANAYSSWMDGINSQQQQQKMNEQVFQAELMRQLEQQFLLQQLQQQDQLSSVMQSLMGGNLPGTSSTKQGSSDAEKMQQQMAMMMQQFAQHGGASALQGMPPGMSASLFSTPGALETMMAMSQMGNLNSIPGIGNLQTPKSQEDKRSPSISTSQRNSVLHSPYSSKNHQHSSSPALPSSSKRKEQLISPRKTQQTDSNAESSRLPAIPPGLSPDNALLAMLYSQQLQYDELIKQQLETVNKMREEDATSSFKETQKLSKSHVKQEQPRPLSRHNDLNSRSNLHSPANSTSSARGKAHFSPTREFSSKSPSRKSRESERNQSHGSSSKHVSPPRKKTSSKDFIQGNMSETLRLFSALASNPNLTQQELTALLSFPGAADPTSLFSGMGPTQLSSAAGLLDPVLSAGQMVPAELEKLNKNIAAAALDMERQKLEEQMKSPFQPKRCLKKGSGKGDHISVLHPSSMKFTDADASSLSQRLEDKVDGKRSSGENKVDSLENGDAVSSDGDITSESSIDRSCGPRAEKKAQNKWRLVEDDDGVMEPLKHGWKREVRFRPIGKHFRVEVLYIVAGGKKLRSYPDVITYLNDSEITNLHKNNFSFSSRLRVGKFYEQKEKEDGGRQWVELTEEELDQHIQHLTDDGQTSNPFPDNSDQMSNHSSSSKGDSQPRKKHRGKEKEREKERLRFLKEQEEFRRLEQQRIEREIRERLALEELERQRVAEALEREKRRQQLLLMRAMESRKRAEERERRREEIRIEKMMQREKKMEQRRIAMQIARELRMPVEDMATIGAPALPDLTRLQGTYDNKCQYQLSGNACGDILMVVEFIKTFQECIRLGDTNVPTFEKLQLGLLNDPIHTTGLVQITMALLHQCLCDPGVPAPGPWLHCLTGVKVTDIDVSTDNYSEILRLFIWARSGYKTEIALHLESLPFLSLTADEKATCLAFLVNELVCSRPICMEIEKNLDTLSTLRRDKWMVEGQIRQLRIAYEKNPNVDSPILKMEEEGNSSNSFSSKTDQIKEEHSEESLFQKKMEELTQQHNSFSMQLAHTSKPLRPHDLGQDRYKRRYWVLPNLGGVYVEGLESGISYEDDDESPDEDDDEEDDEDLKDECETQNPESMEVDSPAMQDHNLDKEAENDLKLDNSNQNDWSEAMEVNCSDAKEDADSQLKDEAIKCELSGAIHPGAVAELSENETSHSENHAQSTKLLQENGPTDTQLTSETHKENSKPSQLDNSESTIVNQDSTADSISSLVLPNSTCDSAAGSVPKSGLGNNTVPSQSVSAESLPKSGLGNITVPSQSDSAGTVSRSRLGNNTIPSQSDSVGSMPKSGLGNNTVPSQSDSVGSMPKSELGNNTVPSPSDSVASMPKSGLGNNTVPSESDSSGSMPKSGLGNDIVPSESDSAGSVPKSGLGNNTVPSQNDSSGSVPISGLGNDIVPSESDSAGSVPKSVLGNNTVPSQSDSAGSVPKSGLGNNTIPSQSDSACSVPKSGLGNNTVPSQIGDVSTTLNSVELQSLPPKVVLASKNTSDLFMVARTGDRSLKNEEKDKVIAAAKAIAAKAVASSSHLLFPKGGCPSPTKSKPKKETEVSMGKDKDKKSSDIPDIATGGLAIGEHMINALVQMGVNPTSLTSQQMEVLSHLGISASILSDFSNFGVIADSISKLDQKSDNTSLKEHPLSQSFKPHINEVQTQSTVQQHRKRSEDQDAPMDLSRPVTSQTLNQNCSDRPSTPNSVKSAQVQIESMQRDSPFTPVHESPDSKSIDSKFFVPISHSTSGDGKIEQQQYNQVMSTCPSPNTLANYIVSSVNYGNFPALDDIKFPIRAPDVKEEPSRIPRERKRGWWRIESESELRSLSEKLYLRGIREKQLHRNITKNFDICTNSMAVSALPEHKFAVLTKDSEDKDESKSEEKLADVQKIISGRGPSQERKFDVTSRFVSSENLAYESEMQVLYRVEELSARCVNMGVVSPQWRNDNPKPSMMRKDLTHVPLGPLRDETGVEIKFDALNPIHHDPKSVLGAAVDFLGCLERAVCRSYLKPPLVRKGGASEFSNLPSLSESGAMDVAAGLRTWRNAVASSASASQLSLCIRMLEACVAWDRSAHQSPTKLVTSLPLAKAKKRKTDKRSTPKNTITHDSPQPKKRKKKKTNPHKNGTTLTKEGKKVRMPIDTADVISKSGATPLTNGEMCNDSVDNSISSDILGSFGDFLAPAECNSEFAHKNGPEPRDFGAPSSPAQNHTNSDNGNVSEEYRPSSEPKKKKKKKKKMKLNSKDELPKKHRKPRKRADKDTVICRGVLRELQSHEDATWFLFPVDCKLVPGYRKIIQKPIDFHTIESRLKRGRYKSKEEFVSEVCLVFDNCRKFNEDDSNIGRAGHQIRNHFERRWAEVLRDKYGETSTPPEPHPLLVNDVGLHINQEAETSIQEPESEPLSEAAFYQDSESGLVIDDS